MEQLVASKGGGFAAANSWLQLPHSTPLHARLCGNVLIRSRPFAFFLNSREPSCRILKHRRYQRKPENKIVDLGAPRSSRGGGAIFQDTEAPTDAALMNGRDAFEVAQKR